MKDLAEEYLLVCETDGYTVETIRQKRVLLNQFIRYCNQNEIEDVEEITSAFLRKWIIDEKKRCKGNSINAKIQHIRPFFNWLIEEAIIERNPWSKIKLLKSPPPIIHYDKEDIYKMLNYWKGNKFMPVRNKTMVVCLEETGIRNTEMRNIKLNKQGIKGTVK